MAKRLWLFFSLTAFVVIVACQSRQEHEHDVEPTRPPMQGSVVPADPEPRGSGFKALDQSCTEPVVRVVDQPVSESNTIDTLAKNFVREHKEFAPPTVQFAEAEVDGRRLLLARCRDSSTANRLAARIRDWSRTSRAVPMCGFGASGWTASRRRVHVD